MNRAPLSLKSRALQLLSLREHSRLELERKLRQHETREGELAEALDALAARGFISPPARPGSARGGDLAATTPGRAGRTGAMPAVPAHRSSTRPAP